MKDTAAKPDASVLWAQLAQAQVGLKKYDDAEATYKKALDLEAASKKPNPRLQGIGQQPVWARFTRAPARFPRPMQPTTRPPRSIRTQAGFYLKNEAVIFLADEQRRRPGGRGGRGHQGRSQRRPSFTTSRARG